MRRVWMPGHEVGRKLCLRRINVATGWLMLGVMLALGMGAARADRVEVHKWQIQVEEEVIQQGGRKKLRACAGGVDDHTEVEFQYRAHTRRVTLRVMDDQQPPQPLTNAPIELRFAGETGYDYNDGGEKLTARLHLQSEPFDAAHPWVEVLSASTNGEGRVALWIKSGDLICQPKLQVFRFFSDGSKSKVGEIECDFVAVQNYRRFGIVGEDGDTGWKFDDELLFDRRGNKVPAKLWLKIQKDPSIQIDTQYFESDGETPRRPADWSNWQSVQQHDLQVVIGEIVLSSGTAVRPENFSDYVTLVTEGGMPVSEVEVRTERDGSAGTWLKAGALIGECKSIRLDAYELSQFAR